MYNQILSEAYAENEELKRKLEYMGAGNVSRVSTISKEEKKPAFEYDRGTEIAEEKREDAMTDKELQRLKRGELLEILLEQSRENEALKLQLEEKNKAIDELKEKLENRKIDLEKAGTIAEASFKLNGVFDAAEKAAQQYLENLQELYEREKTLCTKKETEFENKCAALMQATQERCDFMKEDTIKKCEEMEASVKQKCDELLTSTERKCKEREKESEERCIALDQKAKTDVDNRWNDLSKRLEDFYAAHEGLRELLATSKMI